MKRHLSKMKPSNLVFLEASYRVLTIGVILLFWSDLFHEFRSLQVPHLLVLLCWPHCIISTDVHFYKYFTKSADKKSHNKLTPPSKYFQFRTFQKKNQMFVYPPPPPCPSHCTLVRDTCSVPIRHFSKKIFLRFLMTIITVHCFWG